MKVSHVFFYIVAQGSHPGLLIYRLIAPIANVMPGLIQIITYIKLPTTEAYGTFLILAFSFSPLGHCLAFNLQFVGNAEPIGFV